MSKIYGIPVGTPLNPNIIGSVGSGVYTLAEGETLDDVSNLYNVVIDPRGEEDPILTDADKQEIVNLVLEALPSWNGGSY